MGNFLRLLFPKAFLLLSLSFHVWVASSSLFTRSTTASLQNGRLVMRLIHRDSVLSPFYNKSSTISDRANFAIESSMARLAHIKARTSGPFLPHIEGTLVPNSYGTIFFLNVSVGEPPIPQLVIVDTGSTLLWIQCQACSGCRKTRIPRYNPNKSSSYAPLTCDPVVCAKTYNGQCDSDGYCSYSVRYRDGTNSSGVIAYEKFTFQTYNEGTVVAPSLIFGCGTKHNDDVSQSNGVLGLSANNASILSSIGSKFSYCIGNISDPHYIHNHLTMGNGSVIDGSLTPFQTRRGFFYISLEGITVNDARIEVNPREFKFNVLIDSGSTLSRLSRKVYEALRAEVMKIMDESFGALEPLVLRGKYKDLLCYKGDWKRDAMDFPPVTLHFAEETDLAIDGKSLFFQLQQDTFCMAINAQDDGLNVIGIILQQYYNVGYDLEAKKISFRAIKCELLEEYS